MVVLQIFLQLQGLKEEEIFEILGMILYGELRLQDVRKEEPKLKNLATVQGVFCSLVRMDWKDCRKEFPAHTQEETLQQFVGMYLTL